MNSITNFDKIKKYISEFSLTLFKLETILDLISTLDNLSLDIEKLLDDCDLIYYLNEILLLSNELDPTLKKLTKNLKKVVKKKKLLNDDLEPYAGFKVDDKPIFSSVDEMVHEKFKDTYKDQKKFEELNEEYKQATGEELPKIKSTKPRNISCSCPYCNAPSDYIYRTNKTNKYKCKICERRFTQRVYDYNNIGCFCPHCKYVLTVHHDHNNYLVYRCRNNDCSFYKENKKNNPDGKLRYRYREFKFTFNDVNKPNYTFDTKVDLGNIRHDLKVVGLALTFYINYGCSTRKTSLMLKELYGIRISHQTIYNYAEAVAARIQHLNSNYKYDLSDVLSGDETYIKSSGKHKYVFFFSDPINKIITSYKIYDKRDTKNAIESILISLKKYKKIPKNLLVVTDGNPIYNAAQLFLANYNFKFHLMQVIGISNKDETSTKYRVYKQVEERLNRTYKQNYHGTTGYKSIKCANVYMVLFVAFFNFLRTHSSLNYKTPVIIDELSDTPFMYDKWIKLLGISNNYIS